MKPLLSTVFSCLLLIPVWADVKGQASATATGPGSYAALGAGFTMFQSDYGRNELGGSFGYLDINPQWRLGMEAEARSLHWHTDEHMTEASYLGGVRVVLSPRPSTWQPYAKFLAGAGRVVLPYGYAKGTFLTYAPGVGLDISLNDRITVRAMDVEYQQWPQFPYGSLSPYGVSAGLSLRLNRVSRYPKGARARH